MTTAYIFKTKIDCFANFHFQMTKNTINSKSTLKLVAEIALRYTCGPFNTDSNRYRTHEPTCLKNDMFENIFFEIPNCFFIKIQRFIINSP